MFLGRATSSRSSDSHWLTAVKAALLREAETCAQPPAYPWNTAALVVMCLPSVTTVVPNKAPLYGSLAAGLATERFWHCQQHHLPTADSSKPLLNARGGNWNPLFICKPGCVEEQWHCGCTHCVHSPWQLDRQRRSTAWKLGNCKNCIMRVYNLPLWVQGWLNTGCYLLQEQHFLGSELGLVAVLWKPEEKQMSHVLGDLLCRRRLCFLSAHLILRRAAKNAVLPLGGSMEGHFLKGRKLLSLLCLSS